MAFAIASGRQTRAGIVTAIVAGFLISALGGSQVQIGGPAGAFIVIVYGIVARYGLTNLLIATALSGVLLFTMGLLRLGALVRFIPVTIIIGFTNGIAVLIGLSQLKDLFGLKIAKLPADSSRRSAPSEHASTFNPTRWPSGWPAWRWWWCGPSPTPCRWTTSAGGIRLPRAARARHHRRAGAGHAGHRRCCTCRWRPSAAASAASRRACRHLQLPPFSWESAKQLVFPTLTLALLGAIESLLCARVADNLIDAPRHATQPGLMAQGVANMVAPPSAASRPPAPSRAPSPTCAPAPSPVAGMVHSATLLAVVLAAAPLARNVPLAALAGILLFVAWNMGEWREFARLRHFSLPYRTIMLGTFFLTVVFDLTVAVEVGLMLACVFFIYRAGTLFRVEPPAARPTRRACPPAWRSARCSARSSSARWAKLEALPACCPKARARWCWTCTA